MRLIHSLSESKPKFDEATQNHALNALETGHVVYFPNMPFLLLENEKNLLSPDIVKPGVKNVSYISQLGVVRGLNTSSVVGNAAAQMMHRFVGFSTELIESLFPHYKNKIEVAKTSYRPVEIEGRPASYRKDDTRLHVDAFPSSPNQGRRILRVFSNINPYETGRHWRMGESFDRVAKRFVPQVPKPLWGMNRILGLAGITKGVRSDYDYYMLQIHNRMKKDEGYQKSVGQEEFHFPPKTTWIVMTDQVSHAAMSGQYLLEQTFYLPVAAMRRPEYSPLRILEKLVGKRLA